MPIILLKHNRGYRRDVLIKIIFPDFPILTPQICPKNAFNLIIYFIKLHPGLQMMNKSCLNQEMCSGGFCRAQAGQTAGGFGLSLIFCFFCIKAKEKANKSET
jgi:hypothetical protein